MFSPSSRLSLPLLTSLVLATEVVFFFFANIHVDHITHATHNRKHRQQETPSVAKSRNTSGSNHRDQLDAVVNGALFDLAERFFAYPNNPRQSSKSTSFAYLNGAKWDALPKNVQGISNSEKQIPSVSHSSKSSAESHLPDFSRFDTAAPPIIYASSPGSLPSLPSSYRVPQHVIDSNSFQNHYSKWSPKNDTPTLFVYNPSLIPLFQGPTHEFKAFHSAMESLKYLASFRLSSVHSCGFSTYEFWKYPVNYIGLAILNDQLKVARLQDDNNNNASPLTSNSPLDIIVDINSYFPRTFSHGSKIKFEDVRLFQLHNRVYLSSGPFLLPICVMISPDLMRNLGTFAITADLLTSPALCDRDISSTSSIMDELPPLFPNQNNLRLFVTGNLIKIDNAKGKNFQFFHAPRDEQGGQHLSAETLMEIWPASPRLVYDLQRIPDERNEEDLKQQQLTSKPNSSQCRRCIISLKTQKEIQAETLPKPISSVAFSLDTTLSKAFTSRDRGTACCVRIEKQYYDDMAYSENLSLLGNLSSILVGISHSKSHRRMPSSQGERYNYLSRLYAFSSSDPYQLIARSGLFCFGFPEDEDATGIDVGSGDAYNRLTKFKRLEINGNSYNCPNIHFASGITEKVGDLSRLIVAYGVNDCVPRFVEISKRDFVMHLFTGDAMHENK